LALIAAGCYFPGLFTSKEDIANEIEQAVNKALAQTEEAKPAATYTPYPTYTPMPTYTSVPPTPYRELYYPSDSGTRLTWYCLDPDFVNETIPDNTVFSPGETFTKTWTLENEGQCTWTTNYNLVFVSGNSMSGDTVIPLAKNVPPGGRIVLSVDLKAPSAYGTYIGNWGIETDDGDVFANFWVQIKVR
jgi:hypothetical protein